MRIWQIVRRLLLRRLVTPLNVALLGAVSMLLLLTASLLLQMPSRTCSGPACTDAELARHIHVSFGGAAWTAGSADSSIQHSTARSAAQDAEISIGLQSMATGKRVSKPHSMRVSPHRAAYVRDPGLLAASHTSSEQQEVTPAQWVELRHGVSAGQKSLRKTDLLAVIPINADRQVLAGASRSWRRGVPAFFASNAEMPPAVTTEGRLFDETYGVYPDDTKARSKWPGDTRAAIAPFLAAKALGPDSFKWLLSGDDDTVFFIDNVMEVLAGLDHNLPYIISDAVWFYNHSSPTFDHFHPHPLAPRCLPCAYQDPSADWSRAPFAAPRGCPCTPALLCQADSGSRFDKATCELLSNERRYGVGRFYNIHGGSGVILSAGLMRQIPFKTFRRCLKKLPGRALGGDAMFSQCLWQLGYAPTDPGYGFTRPHIQMFDPGPGRPSLVHGMLAKAQDGACDASCHDQLEHLLSTHVRARQFGGFAEAAVAIRNVSWAMQRYLDKTKQL